MGLVDGIAVIGHPELPCGDAKMALEIPTRQSTLDLAFRVAWIVEEGIYTMTIPSLKSYRIRCVTTGP